METQAFAVFLEKHHQAGPNIFDEAAYSYVSTFPSLPPPPPPPPASTPTTSSTIPLFSASSSNTAAEIAHLWDSLSFLSAHRGKVRETAEVSAPDVSGLPPDAQFTYYLFCIAIILSNRLLTFFILYFILYYSYSTFPKLKPDLFPLNPTPPPPITTSSVSSSPSRAPTPLMTQTPFKLNEDAQKSDGIIFLPVFEV